MRFEPVHRSIVAVDIESYSKRLNPEQIDLRDGLRDVLSSAFEDAGISRESLRRQDQGDAELVLIRPAVPKTRLLSEFVSSIHSRLSRYNERQDKPDRMRLRMAIHAGEVHLDRTGFPGEAVVAATRLRDAAPLRRALALTPGDLAVIVSERIYHEIVRHRYPGIFTDEYREVIVREKSFRQRGWIRTPGYPVPLAAVDDGAQHQSDNDSSKRDESSEKRLAGVVSNVVMQDNTLSGATFHGPTSFGGHAAGRDIKIDHP